MFVNAVQKWLIENTRLGIPAMTHEEALHGLAAPKGTNFPIPIALASTWDPALLEKVMSVAALEARARGHAAGAVARARPGPRPALGPHRGDLRRGPVPRRAAGRGRHPRLPGHEPPLAADKVFATAKHFAGHGPHEGGINTAPASFAERAAARRVPLPVRGRDHARRR